MPAAGTELADWEEINRTLSWGDEENSNWSRLREEGKKKELNWLGAKQNREERQRWSLIEQWELGRAHKDLWRVPSLHTAQILGKMETIMHLTPEGCVWRVCACQLCMPHASIRHIVIPNNWLCRSLCLPASFRGRMVFMSLAQSRNWATVFGLWVQWILKRTWSCQVFGRGWEDAYLEQV